MFAKKSTNDAPFAGQIDSLIGADAMVEGNLKTGSAARIDGEIKGDIEAAGTLVIGKSGKVQGDIRASYILVGGEVTGDLKASEKVEVLSSGRVLGNIQTKSLVVDENAMFQGQCIMNVAAHSEKRPAEQASPEKKTEEKK